MIKLNAIGQTYNNKTALADISLEMQEGKFYALLGHNGAGKSTLLNIIAGLEYPSTGFGKILGFSLGSDLGVAKTQIGYVSEKVNFGLSIALKNFFKSYATFYKNWDHSLFEKLIQQQKLDISKEFSEFSRGQKMQLVLIATLARQPKILLIDEITSVLDVNSRTFFMNYLKDFAKLGGIVVMTTNIIHEVNQQATDAIILQNGKILLNSDNASLDKRFIKLRRTVENKNDQIFNVKECVWIGQNSDLSDIFIIEEVHADSESITNLKDKRKLNLSEVFMYFNEREKIIHEAA